MPPTTSLSEVVFMDYRVAPRDYLARAQECLRAEEPAYLFYAAFEIRCGVEARCKEYLQAQEGVPEKKKKGWKVAELHKDVEEVFRVGDQELIMQVCNAKTGRCEIELRYTPVKQWLKSCVGKLGGYLHAAKRYHPPGDAYW